MTGPARNSAATRPKASDGGSETTGHWAADAKAGLPLIEAIAVARAATAELTGLPVDGIAGSAPDPASGGWRITIEVIESAARMGENDLLAAYEVGLGPEGGLVGFDRARRYRREDKEDRT